MVKRFNPASLFTTFVFVCFFIGFYKARDYSLAGRLFPMVIACVGIILTLIQLIVDLKHRRNMGEDINQSSQDFVDIAPDADIPKEVVRKRGFRFLSWFLGLYLSIWILGFKISVPAFIVAYLRIEIKANWSRIVLLTTITIYLIFYHFEKILGVFWPKPLIADWIKVPFII